MQRTATGSRSRTARRSCGSKRASCSSAAAPADPRRDEDVAGRLAPAAGRRAPHELAGAGVEPVLGLDVLAGEVALGVDDGLRLARGPAREGDEARVLGVELDRRRRGGGRVQRLVGDREHRAVRPGGVELGAVALVADDRRRPRDVEAQPQVAGAQLLGAGQDDRADAEARDHRQHPLRAVADQRQDDVAAPRRRARASAPASARGALGDLAERPLAPAAVAVELDEREARRDRRRRRGRGRSSCGPGP